MNLRSVHVHVGQGIIAYHLEDGELHLYVGAEAEQATELGMKHVEIDPERTTWVLRDVTVASQE